MVIRCRHCGKLSETENELMDGMSICCPYCGVNDVEMYYRKMADGNLKPEPRSTPAQILPLPLPQKPRSVPKSKLRVIGGSLVFLFVIFVIGGLVFYWKVIGGLALKSQETLKPVIQRSPVAIHNPVIIHDPVVTHESDELEKQRRARLAREEAEREKQKAERMAEREKELQAERQRAEAEKEVRALVENVEKRFKTGPFVFASDFPEEKWPLKKDGTFYAIGRTYQTDQKIYEVKVENGKAATVRAISPQGIEEIGAVDFSRKRALVVGDDGIVWIFGTGKAAWTEKATLAQDEIDPANTELKGLYSILKSWGRIPEYKLRISLKPLNGGKSIPMGIIDYGAPVTAWKIRDALLPVLRARREESIDLPKPRLKTFKPNVVFYGGDTVRTGFGGITQVPRTFVNTNLDRWLKLNNEAQRQERKLQEVRRENERLMQEYESKVREILSKEIRGEEIEAEARKYVLLIERSRSKLPKRTSDEL